MPQEVWSTSTHGVVPPVDLALDLREAHAYLYAFLRSEHQEFRPPYEPVRANISVVIEENAVRPRVAAQRPSADVEDSRLRTWKKEFEELGFIYVDDDQRIRTTALGSMIRDLHDDIARKISGANDHVAALALAVLDRHILSNPLVAADYPPTTDLHPYRAIWKTARSLQGRVHWQELNRVIFRVLREEDLPTALAHIAAVREACAGDYEAADLAALGEPAVDEGAETRRRITSWISRAGFGGVFLQEDEGGFWRLSDDKLDLIDEVLATPPAQPPVAALTSREAYLSYVISGLQISALIPTESDEAFLTRALAVVSRFGSNKIIVLTGLPGTGKTRIARMLAARLTDNDPFRLAEIQFHEATTYDKFVEGFVPRADGSGYELMPMTLRVINNRALRDPRGRTYVLLIEEFTRADIHSVLGELLTYIEHRDRGFRLPLSQTEMRIAPNLVVLATMNPRDRSALTLDDAILRRLHQVTVESSPATLSELIDGNLPANIAQQLVTWYSAHYATLPFGHGEFADVVSVDDLRDIWQGTLIYFLRDASGNTKAQYQTAVSSYPWS